MSTDPLHTPVQYVRGVGPQRAELLQRLGILTVYDLLLTMPRDVIDLSRLSRLSELDEEHEHSLAGEVVDRQSRLLSQGRTLTSILLRAPDGYVRAVWFNQPYMLQKFRPHDRILISGQPHYRQGRWEFAHPRVQWLGEEEARAPGILPRYNLTEGLSQEEFRRITAYAVDDYAHYLADSLPADFRQQYSLPSLAETARGLHAPATIQAHQQARRRLIFEDLLEFQLALALRRRLWIRTQQALPLLWSLKIDQRIRRRFPFPFTPGQELAIREIVHDLQQSQPMHRLLQADVGAGKTVVALYALLMAVANHTQAALLAPTEVLAQQHWNTCEHLLQHSRVRRCLFTGQLDPAVRTTLLQRIAQGEIDLVIGTHALLQRDVQFSRLAVVVIDEQHKFGVLQRARFLKAESVPHTLVMTATPIPRTLALTQYGDLDQTVIRDLPPGRQPVVTSLITYHDQQQRAWEFIRRKLLEGRQAYVVCPRIGSEESDDEEDVATVESVSRLLAQGVLRDFSLGVLHGRMPREQQANIMEGFRLGGIQVLIATSVIEVGVDVPNATLMVIYHPERFGLSQLHQLRGRVGRGRYQGYCFLLHDAPQSEATERLRPFVQTHDGFAVAELDFQWRGPGDVLGTRQHGHLPLRYADLLRDRELVEETRKVAQHLVATQQIDEPAWAPCKNRILDRFRHIVELPATG